MLVPDTVGQIATEESARSVSKFSISFKHTDNDPDTIQVTLPRTAQLRGGQSNLSEDGGTTSTRSEVIRVSPQSREKQNVIFSAHNDSPSASRGRDAVSTLILRKHRVNSILRDLECACHHIRQSSSIPYFNGIMRTMLDLRNELPYDPYLEIIMALYTAMAYDTRWMKYSSDQYRGAASVLALYSSDKSITDAKVNAAVTEFKKLGFVTLPLEIPWDEFEDEE